MNITAGQHENLNDDIVMIAAHDLPETPRESVCATRVRLPVGWSASEAQQSRLACKKAPGSRPGLHI
jgi:hypothetical protein